MKTIFRNKYFSSTLLLVIIALVGAALLQGEALAALGITGAQSPLEATLPTETCAYDGLSNTRTCELWAKSGSLSLPGGASIPIWGYADTEVGAAELPGPMIIANQGEIIEVILHNDLGVDTALIFPGQDMVPDLAGVADGGSTSYSFVASNPGTFLYEAGILPNAQHQVAMGMFGALIVRPNAATTAGFSGQAYDDSSTAYHDEALLVLSEIDPALNNSADPAAFDMREFSPRYWLINGAAYPDTSPIVSTAGNKVLLRFVNAGLNQHSMGTLGMHQEILATDGSPLAYPYRVAAATIGPGQTVDRMVTVPAATGTSGDTMYAVYDTSMLMHNNGAAGFGGLLTFITAGAGTPPANGPLASNLAISPDPTDGSVDVVLSATQTAEAGKTVNAAEYYINSTAGIGNPMTASDGVFDSDTEAVEATITTATLATLDPGDHIFYVRGQDSAGLWGPFSSVSLHLDNKGPTTSGITLAPNPSDGSGPVSISATGDDTATGNSNIIDAEYFIGSTGVDGTGEDMSVNIAAPIASLDASIDVSLLAEGEHTVYVHSQDAFLHWGPAAEATLVIDKTGPTTSNVVADPNPNNGSFPYNPTVYAVRVDATITDGSSTIERAEGFLLTDGVDGSGFPLTPKDGLFDESVEDAYAYIPLSTISQWGVGTHMIWVQGQDASGNWGAAAAVDLIIETDIPTVTTPIVTPDTTDGTILVALSATASDASSDIALAEWFAGADPGNGNGMPMTVSFNGTDWDLTADIDANGWVPGVYTISVRARDAAGNWSATDSTELTVTALPPTEPEQLYFSTAGNGSVPGAGGPNDDADVYLWDATNFSRVLDGSLTGLPGNADIDGLAFEGGLFYLSFNRNGGTNLPGLGVVQDEDVVTYNPEDNQWELFFAGVDECDGLDASNGHDIDAFDVVGGDMYFSTSGNAVIAGQAGPFDDADIYIIPGCARVFDASVAGLPGSADIDGLTVVDGDTFYMSFDQDGTIVPDIGVVQDEDVILYDGGQWSLHFDGTAHGLGAANSQDLDAIDVQ